MLSQYFIHFESPQVRTGEKQKVLLIDNTKCCSSLSSRDGKSSGEILKLKASFTLCRQKLHWGYSERDRDRLNIAVIICWSKWNKPRRFNRKRRSTTMTASAEKDWTRNSDNERFLVMFVRNIIFNNVEKCFVATKLGDKISPVYSLRVENLLFFYK